MAGLYARPTVVNNTETLANVPLILERGADWYKGIGTEKSPGTKAVSYTHLDVYKRQALDWGVTGALLRATGVAYDLRRAVPYLGYEDYDFEVPVFTTGDAYARYLIRIAEIRESVKIIRQALDRLPGLSLIHI